MEELSRWAQDFSDARYATRALSSVSTPKLELEHALMAGRIMDARSAILRRLEMLRDMPGLHEPERQAIQDALSGLRSLEREEVRFEDEKHREAAKLALGRLRSIGPLIDRLSASNVPEQS
jgi:hypothetical protein